MKILVAGDFCPQYRVSELFERGEYQLVLGEVKNIVKDVDYSIVNFECPVTKGGEAPIIKCGPNLQCSEKGVEALKWAGFNCATLANNHIYDYGEDAVAHTIQTCLRYDIDTVGAGLNISKASKILYKTINENRVAIINCCEHEFSIATEDSAGSNPLNPIQQYYDIKKARTEADFVLIIVHGGHEGWQLPSPRMVETYRYFIECGADAVVNHHQHCFSGYEVYKGKPIFYGLGNFCFDKHNIKKGIWNEGFAVCLNFEKSSVSFSLHPYIQCEREARVHFLNEDAFDKKIKELNSIIVNGDVLKKEIDRLYDEREDYYSDIFEPIRCRYYIGAKHRKWLPSLISKERFLFASNYITCESHRDILLYFLRKHQLFN